MAKMYQVDKMAIVATMAIMAFQLDSKSAHVRISYQFESIKMGMSSKKAKKIAANAPRK